MISRNLRLTVLIAIALSILILSLIPRAPQIIEAKNIDKLEHYLAYLILGFLLFININEESRNRYISGIITVILCVLYGGIIEFLQKYTGRTPDLLDLLADFAGSLSGTATALFTITIFVKNERNQ